MPTDGHSTHRTTNRSGGLISNWNRFWFAPCHLHTLGLLRACFGFTLVLRITGTTGLFRIGSHTAQFPDRSLWPVRQMLDTFHAPYAWLEWLPLPTPFWFGRLEDLLLVSSLLLTIGLGTRLVAPLTAALFTYLFFLSQWNYYHHLLLFLPVLWILAIWPSGRTFSLDAQLRQSQLPEPLASILPLRLLQVLVCAIYLFTFLWKLNAGWFGGHIMTLFVETGTVQGPFAPWLQQLGNQTLSLGTLAMEGFLPLGLLFRPTRRVAMLAGLMLHLSIDATMRVNTFSYQMVVLYLAFIHPACGATVVLFDGNCGICRRSRRWANLCDLFQRITWINFRDPQLRALLPALTDEQLERTMWVITPHGHLLAGFAAWRYLLQSFPLTFLPSFLLYLPLVGWLGDHVYQWVARRRKIVCFLPSAPIEERIWKQTLSASSRAMRPAHNRALETHSRPDAESNEAVTTGISGLRLAFHQLILLGCLSLLVGLPIRSLVLRDARFGWGMFGENTRYLVVYEWVLADGSRQPHHPGDTLRGMAAKVGPRQPESAFAGSAARSRRTRYGIGAIRHWIHKYQQHLYPHRPTGAVALEARLFYAVNEPLVIHESLSFQDLLFDDLTTFSATLEGTPSPVERLRYPVETP